MSNGPCLVRRAEAGDAEAVAVLAAGLARSFAFSRDAFGLSYPALLADGDACLLLAVGGPHRSTVPWGSRSPPSTSARS